MKFSTRAEYGLRALAHLDKAAWQAVSLSSIAKKEGISLAYLERLFARLKRAGLVVSRLGNEGGYLLARKASKIDLLSVIETLEGSVAPYSCASGATCHVCHCKVHPVWKKLDAQIRKTLKNIKLSSI